MLRTNQPPSHRGASVRRAVRCVGAALFIALVVGGGPGGGAADVSRAQAADGSEYRLIVNPGNPASSIDRAFVAQAFLKKIRKWPHGVTIDPVDQAQSAAVRRRCSVEVLGRSVEAVKSYWQQLIFSGRELPPPEMATDDDVVNYVVRKAGGIGYVSASANLRGAKVLTVR